MPHIDRLVSQVFARVGLEPAAVVEAGMWDEARTLVARLLASDCDWGDCVTAAMPFDEQHLIRCIAMELRQLRVGAINTMEMTR